MSDAPVKAASEPEFPLAKPAIWALCILLTPICGAVLYYMWKEKHPEAAKFANRASWVSWVLWIVVSAVARNL